MLKFLVIVAIATLSCHAFPRHHRLRREAESDKYASCKNTYDQCPEWKGQGMCVSDQYKDYMETVCPVTCEFCKENHARRDEIDEPEDFYAMSEEDSREEDAGDEEAEESGDSESGRSEESGSGSDTDTEEVAPSVVATAFAPAPAPATMSETVTANAKATVEISESGSGNTEEESGQSEEAEDDETNEDDDDDDAAPIQTAKQAASSKKAAKGNISLLLKQNFRTSFKNTEDASFQMLEGNVKRDFEKALKGVKVRDISFSEGNIEGNPRQNGKTKVSLTLKSKDNQKIMKKLLKMVDGEQSINGLSVVAGSLEFDD